MTANAAMSPGKIEPAFEPEPDVDGDGVVVVVGGGGSEEDGEGTLSPGQFPAQPRLGGQHVLPGAAP